MEQDYPFRSARGVPTVDAPLRDAALPLRKAAPGLVALVQNAGGSGAGGRGNREAKGSQTGRLPRETDEVA